MENSLENSKNIVSRGGVYIIVVINSTYLNPTGLYKWKNYIN